MKTALISFAAGLLAALAIRAVASFAGERAAGAMASPAGQTSRVAKSGAVAGQNSTPPATGLTANLTAMPMYQMTGVVPTAPGGRAGTGNATTTVRQD